MYDIKLCSKVDDCLNFWNNYVDKQRNVLSGKFILLSDFLRRLKLKQ